MIFFSCDGKAERRKAWPRKSVEKNAKAKRRVEWCAKEKEGIDTDGKGMEALW